MYRLKKPDRTFPRFRPERSSPMRPSNASMANWVCGRFLVILSVVSAAIVAFIIYTLTLGKIREIAVLKLIGTRNRTIVALIMQQSIALGLIGFVVGKITATLLMAPIFPNYVLLEPLDSVMGFVAVVVICILASIIAIRAALKIDPAEAIGG
jgi:putative ABC transport system permease protein